ncbi:MAG TPA: polysaccharide biosynthesis tyrosine autokinase [Gemmatimonadaceae bacterium]|nr:polysaccharide biosynthesis tyrosine autokinase [Gemmatimonadaceae bacterium]
MDNLPAIQSPFDEPNQEIDLRRAWQTIARSAWIIVVCVGLAVAAAVVAARRIVPQYSGAATVRLQDPTRGGTVSPAMMYFGSDNTTSLAMAAEVITSRTLAAEVVDTLGLRLYVTQPPRVVRSTLISGAHFAANAPSVSYSIAKVPAGHEVRVLPGDSVIGVYPDTGAIKLIGGAMWLTSEGRQLSTMQVAVDPRIGIAEQLRAAIAVQPTNKDANVLMISYTGPDSQLARDIPNAVAHAFVRRRMEIDQGGAVQRMEYLKRQRATLAADVADAEAAIRAYLEKQGIAGVTEEQQALQSRLLTLQATQRDLQSKREDISRALAPLSGPDTLKARDLFIEKLLTTEAFQRSGIATADVSHYQTLMQQRADLVTKRLPSSPDVLDLDKAIRRSQDDIRRSTETFLSNIGQELAALQPRIDAVQDGLKKIPEQTIEYEKLERNRRIVEEMITLVEGQLKDAEIAAAVTDSTASVLDEAINPAPQGGSGSTLIYAVGMFSGLLVGVIVAFMRDWLDTTVRTERDLAAIVGVAVVGTIPNLQQQARSVGYRLPPPSGADERPATGREYQTPAAEAYRTLRTNLNYLTPPNAPHVLVITSALPGDGKTTTAVNLAVTLAHQGQRVILIDAETRRGTVHDLFGIPPAPGFFDLMYGQASPGECIRRVEMEGGGTIDVLPLGSAPSVNPADLLVAGRLQPLFERLRPQYDYVIIDTPPLNLFTDGALIGAHADALLLVARADKTDREELRYAVQQLRNVNVTLAGTILNDVEFRRSSRYRMGYGYYYDYAR